MRQSPLLVSILTALSAACSNTEDGKACFVVPAEQTTCPAKAEVPHDELFIPDRCGWEVEELTGSGTRETVSAQVGMLEACCYPAKIVEEEPNCVIGRPYFERGVLLRAPLAAGGDRAGSGLTARAIAWARAGCDEHASVAAFSRLSLQLMQLGAPSALLRDVHQAAIDELGHAESCWQLAENFGAPRASVGSFPFHDAVQVNVDLPSLAAAAVREGCLSETLGAHVVSVAAQLAPEADVQATLQRIAVEEAAHAVLSFRIVAWALQTGGAEVSVAVRSAFASPWPRLDLDELALRSNVEISLLQAACEQGIAEVLKPAARQLLAT